MFCVCLRGVKAASAWSGEDLGIKVETSDQKQTCWCLWVFSLRSVLFQKKYVRSKKTENEEVLAERFSLPVVLKKRLFWLFESSKFCISFFNPKRRQSRKLCSNRTSSFWRKNTRELKFFEKSQRKRVSFCKSRLCLLKAEAWALRIRRPAE